MTDSRPTPPFVGIVNTTEDALLLFEGSRRSLVPRITRRLLESEKSLITSGAIFVFDELESGIKRWTDSLIWSPSRIVSNFVVYREADQRTNRRSKQTRHPAFANSRVQSSTSTSSSSSSSSSPYVQVACSNLSNPDGLDLEEAQDAEGEQIQGGALGNRGDGGGSSKKNKRCESSGRPASREDREREIVGSLIPSSRFKTGGLIKKTISISINGVAQHLISYFTLEDALSGKLRTPSTVPELASISIPADLLAGFMFHFPPATETNEDGTFRFVGEQDEATRSSTRLPSTRRATSAEPSSSVLSTALPIPNPPIFKRKRSHSLATTMDLRPIMEVSDGELRRGSFPLPSYASPSFPSFSSSDINPSHTSNMYPRPWNLPQPEARRDIAFLFPLQEDASTGGALSPTTLRSTIASLDDYKVNWMDAPWTHDDGMEQLGVKEALLTTISPTSTLPASKSTLRRFLFDHFPPPSPISLQLLGPVTLLN
ncbi:Gti1/Pac2 family-domain-containing protein [Mrakia frigida]|uniref:Gti1/Pac2 family protein n=1 Tax=Mrakia frigida TaxID=29902 RepID=UPI003FCBF5CF